MVPVASIYSNFFMWEVWVKLLEQSFCQTFEQGENTLNQKKGPVSKMMTLKSGGMLRKWQHGLGPHAYK